MESRADSLQDLEIRARIDLRLDRVVQKGIAVLFFRSPRDLRLDISDTLLGINVLQAQEQNDTLSVYLPRDNWHLEGSPENVLYSLTGVDLKYYEVHLAILGLPNLRMQDLSRIVRFERQSKQLFLEIESPLWNRRLWFHASTATLLKEQIMDKDGISLSTRTMSDYQIENGVVLPRQIEIRQGNDRIRITINRRRVNSGLSDAHFRPLRIPTDVTRHNSM